MATKELIKETLLIEAVGQFGVRANGEWIGVNDPVETGHFQKGTTYEVLTNRSKPTPKNPQGKKYISQIIGGGVAASVVTAGTPISAAYQPQAYTNTQTASSVAGKVELPKTQDKEAYWEKKNDSMRLGGIMHDAAQITAALVMVNGATLETVGDLFDSVLAKVVASRNKLD